ncbi:MAG: hypothetical protein M1151_07230 [Candidatus Thermoplasmatota archaeon]|jgi:hypothetical protein|nr:hypothetical protein [Candidatus Thermoplasmatota archaeon]MCL5786435.1 hypothetical protein [Candidatus Thermoplasmatota archaeon]
MISSGLLANIVLGAGEPFFALLGSVYTFNKSKKRQSYADLGSLYLEL